MTQVVDVGAIVVRGEDLAEGFVTHVACDAANAGRVHLLFPLDDERRLVVEGACFGPSRQFEVVGQLAHREMLAFSPDLHEEGLFRATCWNAKDGMTYQAADPVRDVGLLTAKELGRLLAARNKFETTSAEVVDAGVEVERLRGV